VSGTAAVFLDRDGVLNEVVWRSGRPASPRCAAELRLVPDVADVGRLREAGWRVFVVTNQPDVARGLLEPATLAALMERVRLATGCDDSVCCTHDDDDGCDCRKPAAGMLLDLAARWGVDLAKSFIVGDGWRDVEAGRRAGCRTVLLRRPYNVGVEADIIAATLNEAVVAILAAEERN
jgi:D-glycero-D-manno-heptose 1,7-bisphosphate phosphatase